MTIKEFESKIQAFKDDNILSKDFEIIEIRAKNGNVLHALGYGKSENYVSWVNNGSAIQYNDMEKTITICAIINGEPKIVDCLYGRFATEWNVKDII